jgi:hypothetical protein
MEHDWEKYLACMEEVKRRFAILDDALISFRRDKVVGVPNLELACLQLRKIYELIAFGALATNRERYSAVRASYEKDWNLADVLKRVEAINPHSFPVACRVKDEEFFDLPGLFFDRSSLSRLHGELGEVLHAKNPYSSELNYTRLMASCCEKRDKILEILNFHRVWPDPLKDQTFYYVQMHVLPDGGVQVAVFEKVGEPA